MKAIPISNELFQGAVSLQITEQWVKPWRIPYEDAELFHPKAINGKAEIPAGVRIRLQTNTSQLRVEFEREAYELEVDCLIDGKLVQTGKLEADTYTPFLVFELNQPGDKLVELYLSQKQPVRIRGVWIDEDAEYTIPEDYRPRWVAYGSSITQCVEAESPSQTWPALASAKLGLQLTCLGFAANCHMEPMVSRMIRDLPADFVSVCVGVNIMGGSSLSERTFAPALIGFLQTIREKHPHTPLAVISPIYAKERETTDNKVGLQLVKIREIIEAAVSMLQTRGDRHLYYLNGLTLFGEEYADYFPDLLHPNAEGYRIMAGRFADWAQQTVPLLRGGIRND
ncbi:SGNH/GDSL hydrolase family protein [Paenibacillus silviterrae]|uniref:SGNH/GDSL hydrolase family protein n=1 Tax=Paenibacillus silviterrae TaxID=3242194 RepID=UPI002542C788|nr:SGNH/GDSL hydrolase family protein [Paenibacillus chinjuensis]